MVAEQDVSSPEFSGTKKIKGLANRAFEVMRAHGMFMSEDAPIVVTLDSLSAFLVENDGAKPADVATAVKENGSVFAIEMRELGEVVITTRDGHPPLDGGTRMFHSFHERFMTPEPKPERPPRPVRERVKVDPNWATFAVPDYVDEDEEADLDAVAAARAAAEAAAQAAEITDQHVRIVVEPLTEATEIIDEADTAAMIDASALVEPETVVDVPLVETEDVTVEVEPEAPIGELVEAEPEAPIEEEPEPELSAVIEEPVTEEPAIERVTQLAEEPAAPDPEVKPVEVAPDVEPLDLSGFDDAAIAATVETQLGADSRGTYFAGQWMVEERVPRLSRGDLRRAKEYIQEQEQPLTDATLTQDILNIRPNSVEFDLMRFAVNFRLSKEHRDFDFVGTNGQRFWSTNSLPQIGTTRRKPNEIGTDYRFLTEEIGEIEYRSVPSADHILSFYEFSLGVLPYDDDLKRLFAKPVYDDQRSAVLTFEIPQSYTTYLVELRYPTPNRGGFLLGLDDFYAENLVPGAIVSISATENDGHYTVEFLAAEDQNARLLELDDRRSPRYQFRPTTYHCEVASEWLISEERFPGLGSEKPLDDKVRRRPEAVVAATFERIGIEDGDARVASFEDVLAAVNIERPFSETLLRTTLDHDAKVSDDGSGTYTYVPGS